MEQDQAFVEMVAKAIVNNPDDVKTDRIIDERGVLITLHVNPEDMGYVIGRSGQTARSIRTLLKIVGAKNDARVNLKIHEPEGYHSAPAPDDGDEPEEDSGRYEPPEEDLEEDGEDVDTSIVENLNL